MEAPIKNCYTTAELARLLHKPSIDNFTEYRNWVVINFLLSTGARLGSIVEIKLKDIDTDENYIILNKIKNKKCDVVSKNPYIGIKSVEFTTISK